MTENDTTLTTGNSINDNTCQLEGPPSLASLLPHEHSLTTLGPYQIQREIGRGAMGTVYRAVHTKLQRTVALKVLPPELAKSPQRLQRFQREMAAIGRLEHPNIVLATDAGEADGLCYIAMQFIDGHDLDTILADVGKMNPAEACEIIRQAALGLQHICEQGLVHRDIKPSNIVLSKQGDVKILDLGIAMLRDMGEGQTCMTAAGSLMGTPDYIAPEQIGECNDVDIRADIYSLGCTLYGLLSGQPPFTGPGYTTFTSKLVAHANHQPPPLGDLCPEIPADIVELVEKMMAKNRDDRPALPRDVADALTGCCEPVDLVALANGRCRLRVASAPRSVEIEPEESVKLAARRRTQILIVTCIVLTIGLLGVAMSWSFGNSSTSGGSAARVVAGTVNANNAIENSESLESPVVATVPPNGGHPSKLNAPVDAVREIAASNEAIAANTAQIAGTLDEIRQQFAAALSTNGANENPQSPADHYFNACIHSQRGEYLPARRSFLAYFANELPVVDPHLQFIKILKLQEGINGARELYAELPGDKNVPARRLATAMLYPSVQRVELLEQLIADEDDFAPAWYQLSREYSIERNPHRTLAVQAREKELLDGFIRLHRDGKLLRWFLDQSQADSMLSDAETRLKLVANLMGDSATNPVKLSLAMPVDVLGEISVWNISFAIAEGALEVQYRIGEAGEFQSTGSNGVFVGGTEMTDPRTGKPMPKMHVELPGDQDSCNLYVQYLDADSILRGPFTIEFDRDLLRTKWQRMGLENSKRQWLTFQDEKLVFTLLFHNREGVKSLVYGLDEDVPTRVHSIPQEPYGDSSYMNYMAAIPRDTKFATIQVTYADDTQSEVVKIRRRD